MSCTVFQGGNYIYKESTIWYKGGEGRNAKLGHQSLFLGLVRSTLRDTKVPLFSISDWYCYLASFPRLSLSTAFDHLSKSWERQGDEASSYLHKHSRLVAASDKGAAVRGLQGPPPCREACPSTAAEEHSRPRCRPQSP